MRMSGDDPSGRGGILMFDGRSIRSAGSGVGLRHVEAAGPHLSCMCARMPSVSQTRRIRRFPAACADEPWKALAGSGKLRQALHGPGDAWGWMDGWVNGHRSPSIALKDCFDVAFEIVPV
jgi:hypothetical protein